jgi:creatinine amidohydrolase
MMLPHRQWTDMATTDFDSPDVERWIAVLPVAAVEQHGPHLPLGTDALILQGYLDAVMCLLPPELPVTFLPAQWVGVSPEHENFPGTLSISPEMAIALWTSLGDGLALAGIRKLVIANAHGGNVPVMDSVARRLRKKHGMLVVMASFHRFGYPDMLFDPDELHYGIHGGAVETSLMLHLHPELVRMEKAEDFLPKSVAIERKFLQLRTNHPVGFGWMSEDLHPSGAMGNATQASSEAGRQALLHGVASFVDLLHDVQKFELSGL